MPELQASERTRELEITQARLSKPMTSNEEGYFSRPSRRYDAPSQTTEIQLQDCGHGNLRVPPCTAGISKCFN